MYQIPAWRNHTLISYAQSNRGIRGRQIQLPKWQVIYTKKLTQINSSRGNHLNKFQYFQQPVHKLICWRLWLRKQRRLPRGLRPVPRLSQLHNIHLQRKLDKKRSTEPNKLIILITPLQTWSASLDPDLTEHTPPSRSPSRIWWRKMKCRHRRRKSDTILW